MSMVLNLPASTERFIVGAGNQTKLRLVVEISSAISTATDQIEVLNFIVDAVREVIDYDAAAIFLFDEDSRTSRYVAGRGYREDTEFDVILIGGTGIVAHVISTGESVITADVRENPLYLSLRRETRSQ